MWGEATSEETQPKDNKSLVVKACLSLKLKTANLLQWSVLEKGAHHSLSAWVLTQKSGTSSKSTFLLFINRKIHRSLLEQVWLKVLCLFTHMHKKEEWKFSEVTLQFSILWIFYGRK